MDVTTADDAPAAPRTVLFDFDGVLVRGDSFEAFLRRRFRRSRWRLLPVLPLLPLLPVILSGPRGKGLAARVLFRCATLGWSEARYRREATAFGRSLAQRPGAFLRDGVLALRRHLTAGDRVLIVSATEATLLDALFDELKMPAVPRLCSVVRGGWTGPRIALHNYGRTKPATLAAHGIAPPWDLAYSDALSDLPLLAGARRAVLVNPDARTERALRHALGERLEVVGWS